jgi:ribosomal protein S14
MVEVRRKIQSSRRCFRGVILVGKLVGARAKLRRELSS